jgi:aspartyl-tRNA(Asn)/glutamyl-tRNA(Gln) amidotransferase subunit B
MKKNSWEPVIGLEIHAQLNTKSKLFSPAPNRFGDEPNTNIAEMCTGQPGSLPVLNEKAVYKAVMFGLAVNANIETYSRFDRKSYFYPDSPRNFQITQFERPIIKGGEVITKVEGETKKFEIEHAHLEDDAGMLKHFASFTGIDYNRAGAPLLEIVSKPTIHSPKEASAYARAIKAIIQYIDSSDCNMEMGHLRFDVNVSVRLKGEKTYRNKIEIKNLNSFAFLEMALSHEIQRQIKIYEENPQKDAEKLITPATYRWDPKLKKTLLMREKESAEDYRYFPEPDIPPVIITEKYLKSVKKNMPELPFDRFQRYVKDLKLTEYNASILVNEKKLSDYFEKALKTTSNASALCNWITVEFSGKAEKDFLSLKIPPENIAKLINLIDNKTITGKIAKKISDDMIENPKKDPEEIIKENPNYRPLTDVSKIEALVDKVLEENPKSVEDFKNGKTKALAYLVGQIMKLTKGKASPSIVNELLRKKIL